jgi:transposase
MVVDERLPVAAVARTFGVAPQTVYKWLRRYHAAGTSGLMDRSCGPLHPHRKYPPVTEELRQALFRTLHTPPHEYGLNRTTWRITDLIEVLTDRGFPLNEATASRLIREAGYRWKKARVVLTSNDSKFRQKLDRVRGTLAQLKDDEAFFSVDEFCELEALRVW